MRYKTFVFGAIAAVATVMIGGDATSAADKLATVAYNTESIGECEKEITKITVNYDSDVEAEYRWRVQGWCLTIDETSDYCISEDSKVLSETVVSGNEFVLDSKEVYDFALTNSVLPEYKTGEISIFAQPVLQAEELKDGKWCITNSDVKSLELWKSIRDWHGISRFRSLYNIPVKVKVTGKLMLGDAETTSQTGSVKTLADLGLKEYVKDKGVLYGVKIENAIGNDGKECEAKAFLDLGSKDNGFYKLETDCTFPDANGYNLLFALDGYSLDSKQSSLYALLKDGEIRLGYDTKVTFYYVKNETEYQLFYRQSFYNGATEALDVNNTDYVSKKSIDDSVNFNVELNQHSIETTVWHDGCNKWQLDSIQLNAVGDSAAGDVGKPMKFANGNQILNFGVTGQSTVVWQVACNAANEQVASIGKGNGVIQGNYLVYAPQVELKYFRDAGGNLTLFSVTSDGKSYSNLDGMKRSLYGQSGATVGFERMVVGQSISGSTRDLALTEAYAYSGPAIDAVAGYLSDTSNCWSSTRLPSGGKKVISSTDGKSSLGWKCQSKDALSEAEGAVNLSVEKVPINPLIFVAVYEECPAVYCVSYVSSSETIATNTQFKRYDAEPTVVKYDGVEYAGANKVSVACDTEKVEAYRVYAQDGIDDGVSLSGIASVDDLRGYINLGGDMQVYCTRYAWVTGDAVNKVLALGANETLASLTTAAGGYLENTTLCGDLFLKDGKGLLLKIFTPEVRVTDKGWKVSYLDEENGSATDNFATFKDSYSRLQRAQLVGDYRVVIENSTSDGGFGKMISTTVNGVNRKLQLVNTSVSTAGAKFETDKGGGSGGGYTNAYNSLIADEQYATATKSKLEVSGKWLVNPYTATGSDTLSVDEYTSWLNSNAVYSDSETGWQWYVYKYAKAVSTAVVYEGSEENDGSFYVENLWSKKSLNPYTSNYTISFEPFREDRRTGDVYYLKGIFYGYQDDLSETITQSGLDSLKASTSFCHQYSGGFSQCDGIKSETVSGYSTSISGNSVTVPVDGEQLCAVAVYAKFEATAPVQGNPIVTKETISFRDTGKITDGGTGAWVSPSSANDNGELGLDARFVGVIGNDLENSSDDFIAATAIPTTEYVRTTAVVPKYLADLDFTKNSVSIEYEFEFYGGACTEKSLRDKYGNSYSVFSGSCDEYRPKVKRTGYNYSLYGATIWYPEDATVWNYALPGEQRVTMIGTNEDWVNDKLGVSTGNDAQFFFKNFRVGDELDEMVVSYGVCYQTESSLVGTMGEVAESMVGQVLATNQQVDFNDGSDRITTLLEHGAADIFLDGPIDAPAANRVLYDNVFRKGDGKTGVFSSKNENTVLPWGQQNSTTTLQIEKAKSNGIYESSGYVRYVTKPSLVKQHGIVYKDSYGNQNSAVDNGIVYGLGVNDVKILTPTIVTFSITDEHELDQSVKTGVGYPLVLDRVFTISTSAIGSHEGLPGYGTKNYAKYLAEMENTGKKAIRIRFPFVVIKVSKNSSGNVSYDAVRAGQWVTIGLGSADFLLPTFIEEGDLRRIEIRAYACNVTSAEQMNQIEYGMNANRTQLNDASNKNGDAGWNYVARRDLMTAVVGRVYGLSVVDIGDYPLWKSVFRNSEDGLNGKEYYSGLADRDTLFRGNFSNSCFPVVDGEHPQYATEGFSKLGYVTKFRLETVGSMYSADDLIEITPKFYWVDEEGKNRQEVSLYYDTTVGGHEYQGVRIGSDFEKNLVNNLSFSSGDYGVSLERLARTSQLLGYVNVQQFTTHESPAYSFSKIQLNQYTRTFVGDLHETNVISNGVLINGMVKEDGTSLNIPDGVIDRSVQQWYGDYYLPVGLHVTAEEETTVRSNCPMYLYNEKTSNGKDIWKEDGYLIVNFEIRTVNNRKYSLAYDATKYEKESNEQHFDSGHCDMWEDELKPSVKKSSDGVTFVIEDGDFMIFDVKDFGKDDANSNYSGSGTH